VTNSDHIFLIGVCLLTLPCSAQDGTARLTGKVRDSTGVAVPGTLAELRSESAPETVYRTVADSAGVYHFSMLPTGEYTLKLSIAAFEPLTVKSIHILEGEQKLVPALQLEVVSVGCGGRAVPDYIRLLPSGNHIGNLAGSVKLDKGPMMGKSPPIAGADVTLLCSTGKICGASKTDSKGEFRFKALPTGNVSVRVNRAGFYPLNKPGYKIEDGIESVYSSVYIERCPFGNCDPRLLPKRPLVRCE
jgi:hypothetical protein